MPYKLRPVPIELSILRILNTRMILSAKEKQNYINKEKGYEGELMFDKLTEEYLGNKVILNDLLLEVNRTKFQLDTFILSPEPGYIFDVKNYEGEYYYESDNFYLMNGKDIKNPLEQLKRSEFLLRQLFRELGFNVPVKAYLVFINPQFTLFQAPRDQPIILPTQVNRFLEKLKMNPTKIFSGYKKLADQLVSLHQVESPYPRLPSYSYDQIQKGLTCALCHSFSISVGENLMVCDDCGEEENIEAAVLRHVEEIKLLFPDKQITTNLVHEWCKVISSKKKIRNILKQHFRATGGKRFSHYE